jgi:hypothetical protein
MKRALATVIKKAKVDSAVLTTIHDMMPELLEEIDAYLSDRKDRMQVMSATSELRDAFRGVFLNKYMRCFGRLLTLSEQKGLVGLQQAETSVFITEQAAVFAAIPFRLFHLEHWYPTSSNMPDNVVKILHDYYNRRIEDYYTDDDMVKLQQLTFSTFARTFLGADAGGGNMMTFAECFYRLTCSINANEANPINLTAFLVPTIHKLLDVWEIHNNKSDAVAWRAHLMFARAYLPLFLADDPDDEESNNEDFRLDLDETLEELLDGHGF